MQNTVIIIQGISVAQGKCTRVRDKVSMQTVLTALIFQHKQAEPQVYCQKSNRLLGQNIGS